MQKIVYNNIQELESIVRAIVLVLSKTPNQRVQDSMFRSLLNLFESSSSGVWEKLIAKFKTDGTLEQIRCIRSDYVFGVEQDWAVRLKQQKANFSGINKVQYFQSYEAMVAAEFDALQKNAKGKLKRIMFVGSGPFPFSSYLYAKKYGLQIINVDVDQEALQTSIELAEFLGCKEDMEFVCADARKVEIPREVDAVIVAALVGHHEDDKSQIINALADKMSYNQILAARTALGARQLFYTEIDCSKIKLDQVGVLAAPKNVINSVVVFNKAHEYLAQINN
jgi:nicotianamine synthase